MPKIISDLSYFWKKYQIIKDITTLKIKHSQKWTKLEQISIVKIAEIALKINFWQITF